MTSLRKLSIKQKLVLVVMTSTLASLGLAAAMFGYYDYIVQKSAISENLKSQATIIGNTSTAALMYDDEGTASEILSALSDNRFIERAYTFRTNSKDPILAYYPKQFREGLPVPNPSWPDGVIFTNNYCVVFHSISNQTPALIGHICLVSNLKQLEERANRFTAAVLVIVVLTMMASFLFSTQIQKVISGPILALAATASMIAQRKQYSIRMQKTSNDEVGIDCFNEMLTQVHDRDTELEMARLALEQRVSERTNCSRPMFPWNNRYARPRKPRKPCANRKPFTTPLWTPWISGSAWLTAI